MAKFGLPSAETIKARCTTKSAWALKQDESSIAPPHVWTNRDMDPVPVKDQTWNMWTWMAYWATDMINLGTWETASSVVAVGLTWRDAIPIMFVGTACIAFPMVMNGAIGAHLHVPYSVIVRSGFGYYFAYFCICSRAVLAMFWLGIQNANGAVAVMVMIGSIWPSFWEYDTGSKNTAAASSGLSTAGYISYLIFFIIQMPLLLIRPTHLRWLFIVKIFAAPVAAIAMMGYMVHQAGGGGTLLDAKATVSGSERAWLWISCMTSVTGSWSTLACNIMDFSRYANTKPGSKTNVGQYIQAPFLPIAFTLCGTLGIITTSASVVVYGEAYWNPLDILEIWAKTGGHGGRAAAFFSAVCWVIATIGTNVTANSISAANDLTVLCPKYINIRRGCMIAAVIGGWAIVPWKIIASADTFLDFMSGYSVFLAPIAGVILADYWFVKKRAINVPALYDPDGCYRYNKFGTNWQGLVAFLLACIPNLPGLAQSITSADLHISVGAEHIYDFAWLYGFTTAMSVYTVLSLLVPNKDALVPETIDGVDYAENKNGSETGSLGKANEQEKTPFPDVAPV